ncbi:hypothetical protein ES703_94486 [subsurface metagenome]
MSLVALIGGCDEANHRNPTDSYECMGTMTDRILMLVMGLSKSDAVVGKYPVPVLILFPLSTSHGLEKGRVSYENDFAFDNIWEIWYWRNEQTCLVCLKIERVMCGDVITLDADCFKIDLDLGRLITQFSII